MADPEPLPTPAELHKLFDDGQYQPLLAKLAKVQPLNGVMGKPYDKVDLAILKTNTFIAMKQPAPALRAIAEGVKLITNQTDPTETAQARALQSLLNCSSKLAYTPKATKAGQSSQPIGLDLATRDAAYKALLLDLQLDASNKADAAKSSNALPPIAAAIAKLNELTPLQTVVGESDKETQKTIDDLAGQAVSLMNDAIKPMAERAKAIKEEAHRDIATDLRDENGFIRKTLHRTRGLYDTEATELRNIIATCGKIQSAARDFSQATKRRVEDFKNVSVAADAPIQDAMDTLRAFRP
jgi:hypothetical protein